MIPAELRPGSLPTASPDVRGFFHHILRDSSKTPMRLVFEPNTAVTHGWEPIQPDFEEVRRSRQDIDWWTRRILSRWETSRKSFQFIRPIPIPHGMTFDQCHYTDAAKYLTKSIAVGDTVPAVFEGRVGNPRVTLIMRKAQPEHPQHEGFCVFALFPQNSFEMIGEAEVEQTLQELVEFNCLVDAYGAKRGVLPPAGNDLIVRVYKRVE